MRQSCQQHSRVRCNAKMKLLCSESYYDGLLLYAADQFGRRLTRRSRAVFHMHSEYSIQKLEAIGSLPAKIGTLMVHIDT